MQRISEKPLAIVGMACRLPGADNLDEFWQLLLEGRSDLRELPPDRFNRELRYDPRKGVRNKSYGSIGGVVPEKPFDRDACPLPQWLIDCSHKVHLTLCQVAAAACRHGGLDPFHLPSHRTGVYVGHTPPSALAADVVHARLIEQTAQYLREVPGFNELTRGGQEAVIAEIVQRFRSGFHPGDKRLQLRANAYHAVAVISEAFNLNGPAMCFDAACASSMRALGHAARALQLGQIDTALVGGASYCHSDTLVLFSQAQSISANRGSCPFDNDADGLVASEGYVVLVLKTLEQALADGDRIQAVIRRIGVSSDGKGKSLWAPRAEGQVEAIRRAYSGDLSLDGLQYIEMHATSTQVGDATEIDALRKVLEGEISAGKKIPVGSVKANVGHTLETAGLASLAKTVLAVQRGVIPRQANITRLNQAIPWDEVPFFVPLSNLDWPSPAAGTPRRAAVNAFGIGGLNVHVVVDEHVPEASRRLVAPSAGRPDASASPGEPEASASGYAPAGSRPPLDSDDEGIAIIGMGAVAPGARTIEHLWDVFNSGRDLRTDVPPERWDPRYAYEADSNRLWRVPTKRGGFITDFEYDWKRHKVPPKQVASADPLQFMLLDAADQALKAAGYHEKTFDKARTGVIVGTIFAGEFADQLTVGLRLPEFKVELQKILRDRGVPEQEIAHACDQYEEILLKHMPALIDETGSFTASTLASRITKTFDLMGGAVAVDAGESSAMAALSACIDLLRSGDCDTMLCAAGHRAMGVAAYESMAKTGTLSTTADPAGPFDAATTGCVPGEAVGVVILKRLSDAERDGDTIHAVIRGIGAARSASLDEGVREAVGRSLESARISPDEVAAVEAGSSGVPARDEPELTGLARAYESGRRRAELIVGAVAGQTGNTGGASGMLALLKAVAELNHGEVPKNVGLQEPAPYVSGLAKTVHLARQRMPVGIVNARGHGIAGVSSYSQYLLAYHVLVEGGTKIPRALPAAPEASRKRQVPVASAAPAEKTAWRIVRVAGDSFAHLAERASQLVSQAPSLYEQADSKSFQPSDRFRLAVVAGNADDLAAKLKLAGAQLQKPQARPLLAEKGIFYNEVQSPRPRVAFLFPGQGSQYDGMLKALVEEYPPAADALRDVDSVLRRLNLPSFEELAWKPSNGLGKDVWRTQLSLLAADTVVYAAAEAIGLRPDRVAGHSFGELVALTAAGSWTFQEAVRATQARCMAIDACSDETGIMVSTSAPGETLERLCRRVEGRVWPSHFNAPEQTVAGGEEGAVGRLAQLAEQEGYKTKILDVPSAFHTPLMEGVKEPFRRGLQEVRVEPPRIPVLSSVTNKYVADPADIRDNLVVQMTRPVRWTQLIQRLADEGITVFVEVGPKQVLTGLSRQNLGQEAPAVVACDHAKRPGLGQLLFARACVETTGALDSREEPRGKRDAEIPTSARPHVAFSHPPRTTHDAPRSTRHDGLTVLRLSGTPYEMGLAHGKAQKTQIRAILRRYADLAGTRWERLFNLDEAAAQPEVFFGPDEMQELRGIAKGADVTPASIIAHNLRLYYDADTGGVHFAIAAGANPEVGLLHAANEDLAKSFRLEDCLARNVQVRCPEGGIPYVTFCVAGQVGSLNGINAHGLAVSTATLTDIPKSSISQNGRLHTVMVKSLLAGAADIDSAVELIRQWKASGTWGICISHGSEDRVCYVEFDGTNLKVQPAAPSVLAANHRLLYNFARKVPPHSENRLNRLKELLGGDRPQNVNIEQAQAALRDNFDPSRGREAKSPTINTIRRVGNQISIVMQPARRSVWVTGGPLSNGLQNEFTELNLDELLPETVPTPAGGAVSKAEDPALKASRPSLRSDPATHQFMLVAADELAGAYATADEKGVCSRFVMRCIESPLPDGSAGSDPSRVAALGGPAVVVGDSPHARALCERLRQTGVRVHQLATADHPDKALADLERLWQSGPVPHLLLATPFDEDAVTSLDEDQWNRRRTRGVMVPYRICQRWYQLVSEAKLLNRSSLTALTALGGDFGFSGRLAGVEGGALAGLLKGVALELKMQVHEEGFRTKVIDADRDGDPAELAESVCRELASGDSEIEVGYIDGRRCVPRPVPVPVDAGRPADIPQGATFIITGGARGVTAVVARELGKRFGLKLHLIGSSPAPDVPESLLHLSEEDRKDLRASVMKEARANGEKPLDAWARFEKSLEIAQTLRSFADEGIQADYHCCDISDRPALARLLEQIRAADGPIDGIVHGAGFERACRFERKQPELVHRTIAAKVDGAAALLELTAGDPVKYFAGFASVSGRFGGVGQTDYCLANEMLAKLIDWYRHERPDFRATVIHWHAWDDVGMAVRPESKHIAKLHDIRFMPSQEGAAHLIDELRIGLPEPEIVVTELRYCRRLAGCGHALAGANPEADASGSPGDDAAIGTPAGRPSVETLPLVDGIEQQEPGRQLMGQLELNPTSDVFLLQHRYRGRPMLPVVITLEALAEAATLLAGAESKVLGLKDIEILNGLRFLSDNPLTARLHAARHSDGIRCELTADFTNRRGQLLKKDQPYLRCVAELGDGPARLERSLPEPPDSWTDVWYPEEDLVIYHGPVFRTLRQVTVREHDAWARLVAPRIDQLAGDRGRQGWILPPAALDGCFFASGIFLWFLFEGVVAIPAGVDRLTFGRRPRPEENCTVHIRFRQRAGNQGIFDFTLYGEDQTVVLAVDGYRNVIVSQTPTDSVKS